jgi:hypothetical protein
MTMETKHEVIRDILEKYLKSTRKEKGLILDRLQKTVHMHRKAIVRRLGKMRDTNSAYKVDGRGRPLYYTADVTAALRDIFDASGDLCGELLHPIIKEYVSIFKRDKTWEHSDIATGKLLGMSMGTCKDRVDEFQKARRKGRGFSATNPSALKHIIPIFTGPWKEVSPGVGQVDTVVHCGSTLAGNMIYTLNYIDIATSWEVLRAQWNKGQEVTKENMSWIKDHLLWGLSMIHPDSGSEFINYNLKGWCDENEVSFTRSRPSHKNDNQYVEERNGHVVRKHVGYMRLDVKEVVPALNEVYFVLCLYLNHFVTSRRCLESIRVGSKYKKKFEKIAKTPYQRVMEHPEISDDIKEKLKTEHEKLNPAVLKKEIEMLKSKMYNIQRKLGGPQI